MTEPIDPKQQESLNDLLIDAVKQKNLPRVESCLQHGAQPQCTQRTRDYNGMPQEKPLAHVALDSYDKAVMQKLVAGGMPLNAKNADGNTVLAVAVMERNADAVEQLLTLGANPQSTNKTGKTIFTQAREASDNASTYGPATKQRAEKIIDLLLAAMPLVSNAFNDNAPPSATGDGKQLTTNEDVVVRSKPLNITPKGAPKPGTGGKAGEEGFKL